MHLSKTGLYDADCPPDVGDIKTAILSETEGGEWQLPPRDGAVIRHLVAKRILSSTEVSKEEVYEALVSYCMDNGLPTMKTYNGYLWLILSSILHANDPSRRP